MAAYVYDNDNGNKKNLMEIEYFVRVKHCHAVYYTKYLRTLNENDYSKLYLHSPLNSLLINK